MGGPRDHTCTSRAAPAGIAAWQDGSVGDVLVNVLIVRLAVRC